jgi:uncharacterized protein (DUF1499 family)
LAAEVAVSLADTDPGGRSRLSGCISGMVAGNNGGGRGRGGPGADRVFQPAAALCPCAHKPEGRQEKLPALCCPFPAGSDRGPPAGYAGAKAPPINDITTDIVNPPVFQSAQIQRRAGDNSIDYPGKNVADQQVQAYPDITPLETPLPSDAAFAQCLAAAEQLGWRIVGQDRMQGLIEAEDRTLIFGFIDDVVIRIASTGNGSRIDLRSASRAGVGDLGVNARRIIEFTRTFNSIQSKD